MAIKPGVQLNRLQPQMVLAYVIVQHCFDTYGHGPAIITSGNEFDESRLVHSLHYEGMALDFRTHHLGRNRLDATVQLIRVSLSDNYDVVLKNLNTQKEHLHIEYDPAIELKENKI